MIELTQSAREHLIKVLSELNKTHLAFGLKGGGCAGFEYFWEPIDKAQVDPEHEDYLIALDEERVLVVDGYSLNYLQGSIIDYKVSIEGSMLVVDNPLAQSSCGCGTSVAFSDEFMDEGVY